MPAVRITGPNGEAVSAAALAAEIAPATEWGARLARHDPVVSGLSPERLARVLHEATAGDADAYLTLAGEIEERYLHYAAQLQVRRLALDAIAPIVTTPRGVPAPIVDAVHGLVRDHAFGDACADLLDAIGKGYSAVEIAWDYRAGRVRPVAYRHRDPRFFQFDRLSGAELRLKADGSAEGEPLPPGRFLLHMPRIRTGLPIRRGLARSAAWAFLIQSFALQDWSAFCELYGVPLRIGRYPAGASEPDKASLLRAVRAISSDAAAIIPQGMEIAFESVAGDHGEAVFGALLHYMDRQVSKLVVGQTMTADGGASLGQAMVHNEVRRDILRADAGQLARTVQRDLVRWFVAINFGPQPAYPEVSFPVVDPQDIDALSGALESMVPLGLAASAREVRRKFGLREPEEGEEVLG